MFPNDLWQTHFLTRPGLGKILIIPRGKGEKPPNVQLDNLAGAMAAAVLGCAGLSMPACPTQDYPCLSPCPVVPVTVNNSLVARSHSPWRTLLILASFRGAYPDTSHLFPIRKNSANLICLLIFSKLGYSICLI